MISFWLAFFVLSFFLEDRTRNIESIICIVSLGREILLSVTLGSLIHSDGVAHEIYRTKFGISMGWARYRRHTAAEVKYQHLAVGSVWIKINQRITIATEMETVGDHNKGPAKTKREKKKLLNPARPVERRPILECRLN